MHPLKSIIESNKKGNPVGICSVCSSNELVIESSIEEAAKYGAPLLVESTSNQVNQYGGYMNMTPAMFRDYVYNIAVKKGFPEENIILGGDHLGPLVWKDEDSTSAMQKAEELVVAYVEAGYTKIHLDTSMKLKDDSYKSFDTYKIAERGVRLCIAAENAFSSMKQKDGNAGRPVYVIGSEVPIPGGAQKHEDISITRPSDLIDTISTFKNVFESHNLTEAWENVIAVVVQPGVEFGADSIHDYKREQSAELCRTLKDYPSLVFEGHSTDYQNRTSLKNMVEDGIAILKVGPALTFALREGLILLNIIENEMFRCSDEIVVSNFAETLDVTMINNPVYWNSHYFGNENQVRLLRRYSYSDRCRYYLNDDDVKKSINRMFDNLISVGIPMELVSQYFPNQYWKIRTGKLDLSPVELVKDRIKEKLEDYYYAVSPDTYSKTVYESEKDSFFKG